MGKYDHLADNFVKDYENGESIRGIALKYGVAKGTVSKVVKARLELRPKSVLHVLDEKEEQAICRAYLTGRSVHSLGKEYGVSDTTIRKLLAVKHGIRVEMKRKYEDLVPYILEDYSAGYSLMDLSKKYGISRQCILTYMNLEGQEARNYSESGLQGGVNGTYFDSLSSEKAHTLGVLYARATAHEYNTSKFIHLLVKEDEIDEMLEIVNRFADKNRNQLSRCDKSTSKTIRICSVELHTKLLNMGFGNNLPPTSYLGEYKKDFLDGFFMYCARPLDRYLRIACREGYKQGINSYFASRGIGTWSNDLIVGKSDDIVRLVKMHPVIKTNIEDYLKTCSNPPIKRRWIKLLDRINN